MPPRRRAAAVNTQSPNPIVVDLAITGFTLLGFISALIFVASLIYPAAPFAKSNNRLCNPNEESFATTLQNLNQEGKAIFFNPTCIATNIEICDVVGFHAKDITWNIEEVINANILPTKELLKYEVASVDTGNQKALLAELTKGLTTLSANAASIGDKRRELMMVVPVATTRSLREICPGPYFWSRCPAGQRDTEVLIRECEASGVLFNAVARKAEEAILKTKYDYKMEKKRLEHALE